MEVDERVSILAVDDQPENLLALEAIFENAAWKLVCARSGSEALRHLLDGEFAVILMDAQMPVMDGFETARAMRSRMKTRFTPIIFVTATHKDSFHEEIGYDIGAVDYIFKPIVPEVLRAKVSVFVELFRKNKEVSRQAEELAVYKTELEQSLAQQRLLIQELQEARDQAVDSSRFKSEFLANMSHEIRTPMNGILGMIEILLKSGLTDKQREFASTAKEAGRSLLAVINDILDFSKIEAGKLSLELVDFDAVQLVESIAELLSAQARQQSLSLLTFVDPSMTPVLKGDPGRLRQIITNLAGNAIKFSEKGEVLIRAMVDAEGPGGLVRIKFSVTDRGIGLTEEEARQLFKPFVQSDLGSVRKYGGTGLGLSISKRLVELMGGEIGVISVKNHGSTFWFTVPLEKSTAVVSSRSVQLDRVRVLVVDDEPGAREIIHNYVMAWGMQNGTARNSEEALAVLNAASTIGDPYQLVLIDLVMPGSDGIQLGKKIRESESLRNLKLILLTAFDKPGIGEEAIFLGFDAYLTKPVKQSQLLNAITSLFYTPPVEDADDTGVDETGQVCRSELILVAEDHPVNQQVALLLLQQLGFEAHIAENGRRAIEALKRVPYALVFMDCQMPEMDGFQATRDIRKLEALTGRHVPIVAMTAHAIEGNRDECLSAGMDDYISKPIEPGELKDIIAKWLPLKQEQSSFSA